MFVILWRLCFTLMLSVSDVHISRSGRPNFLSLSLLCRSKEEVQQRYTQQIVTEILPASTWYVAEEYHQQYLAKGGQCARTGDLTPIRCYG